MNIYVASSWRNERQPEIVAALKRAGHEVYDFRNPAPGNTGFNWREIDPDWKNWAMERYRLMLNHPVAIKGFKTDMEALDWSDACVLVLPCGRSSHLELGYAVGRQKITCILLGDGEPELMNKMADHICTGISEVIEALSTRGRVVK